MLKKLNDLNTKDSDEVSIKSQSSASGEALPPNTHLGLAFVSHLKTFLRINLKILDSCSARMSNKSPEMKIKPQSSS
jgi:hypothetical protein